MLVTKRMKAFASAHRLLGYPGQCRHLHGHNYEWEVTVSGKPLANGMVMDFKEFHQFQSRVDSRFDHTVILKDDDPLVAVLKDVPDNKVAVICSTPTVENLAMVIWSMLAPVAADNGVTLESIEVWETHDARAKFVHP